jgi:hypothetical protein
LTDQPFTSISGTVVNPDIVTLTYSVGGQTPVTYTWTNGNTPPDPDYVIVNSATGYFYGDVSTTDLPGVWEVIWTGAPGESGLDTTATAAVWVNELTVTPID